MKLRVVFAGARDPRGGKPGVSTLHPCSFMFHAHMTRVIFVVV